MPQELSRCTSEVSMNYMQQLIMILTRDYGIIACTDSLQPGEGVVAMQAGARERSRTGGLPGFQGLGVE